MKFAMLPKPTEPEYGVRVPSKIFSIVIGSSTKNLAEKRLESDVGREIGGLMVADMKGSEVDDFSEFAKQYVPEKNIVPVPLVPEGKIEAGKKDMASVLRKRHLYRKTLDLAIEKVKEIIDEEGINCIEIWCSTGGHAIISVEALLKTQRLVTYNKVILVEATEALAKRNQPELLSFFKKWTKENDNNCFIFARNENQDSSLDYANAIAVNSTYGLRNIDMTDFFGKLTVDENGKKQPQAFELISVYDSYPLYSHRVFWNRQNLKRTQRVVARMFDDIKFSSHCIGILSGNIVPDFLEEEIERLFDEFDITPEIRQFNQIKIEKETEAEFNCCVAKFGLLSCQDIPTPIIDKLFKKMEKKP
ncbi:MAG: hypothetical protein KGI11_08485 [Thaumarchaeota archaeon]|nr:hypothetical protein [Nitrososphaerota archaeon]